MFGKRLLKAFRPTTETLESREVMSALTLVVTNDDNEGPGSLRRAIYLSNHNATTPNAPNVINFRLEEPGAHSIVLTSGLPSITQPVLIDGYSQAGSSRNTNPITGPDSNNSLQTVRLIAASPIARFFEITGHGKGSTIRGLALVSESNVANGITLDQTNNVSITGNRFVVLGPIPGPIFASAIRISGGSHNTVGGAPRFPALQNVMGRYGVGVALGYATRYNGIIGNTIGQANRTSPYQRVGVDITVRSNHNDIASNLFYNNLKAINDEALENTNTNNTIVP